MKTLLVLGLLLSTTAVHASYIDCSVSKDFDLLNRPDGRYDTRMLGAQLKKGDRVGLRDLYQGWVFVVSIESRGVGWIPRKFTTDCSEHEGTP